jgi:hypothetical protein
LISRHVDLIALALLLFFIAVFSGAKHLVVMTLSGPVHYIRMDDGRQVRMPGMPQMPIAPHVPKLPRIALQRD